MAEYFSTQEDADKFIAEIDTEPTFFGYVMTPHGMKWVVELTGRDPYQHFPKVEDHTDRMRSIRAARAPADVGITFTGGLGEHYCSRKCYNAGGATITEHLLRNWTGECSVCRGPVRLGLNNSASMVCWKPGLFLFHCGSASCVATVRSRVEESDTCAVCGART